MAIFASKIEHWYTPVLTETSFAHLFTIFWNLLDHSVLHTVLQLSILTGPVIFNKQNFHNL